MINVYIDDTQVSANSKIVYNRNRLENADYGSLTIVNDREKRYEPYTRILLGTEQYLIESDNPLQLKDDLWEHDLTLTENMTLLTTIFPVDRQFSTIKTIKEILTIYQRELEFYQHFTFQFDTNDIIYNERMVKKQYAGNNLAVIIYDLFRRINAIPRLTWENGVWTLTYELYTDTNNELTINAEGRQSNVNDIDYATEVMNKTRNATNENFDGIWFPSKSGWVSTRSKSTFLQTSDLQFELDSNINRIEKALAKVKCTYFFGSDIEFTELEIPVDFTSAIKLEDDYRTLPVAQSSDLIQDFIQLADTLEDDYIPTYYKQCSLYYNVGKNTIDGLYWKKDNVIISNNIEALFYAIYPFIAISAKEYIEQFETFDFNKFGVDFLKSYLYDIECRFLYKPERDIDFIAEKRRTSTLNKTTILNNQKDGSIDLPRYLQNASNIADRIGNEIKNITETFTTIDNAWKLGDYFILEDEYWIITNIRYAVDKTLATCIADFTKNFSNTNRETGITRKPDEFYNYNSLQSNYIYREYLVFYSADGNKTGKSILTDTSRRIAMNIFDYDEAYNNPFNTITYQRKSYTDYINMPLYNVGGGNVMLFHGHFTDNRVAGYGLKKVEGAWYKNPVYYVDSNFELDEAKITIDHDCNYFDDSYFKKYYPKVKEPSIHGTETIVLPFDKDVDDTLAITYEIILISNNKNIIINNGFAKYCNLIKDYDTEPSIELYSDMRPYTEFDIKARGNITTGNITLTDTKITVTDSIGNPIQYWAIVYNGEIILSANNYMTEIKYIFIDKRDDYSYDRDINIPLRLSIDIISKIVRLFDIEVAPLLLDVTTEGILLYQFNVNATQTIKYDVTTTAYIFKTFTKNIDLSLSLDVSVIGSIPQEETGTADLALTLSNTNSGEKTQAETGTADLALTLSNTNVGEKNQAETGTADLALTLSNTNAGSLTYDTTQPNITDYAAIGLTIYWQVLNNDSLAATIKTEVGDSTPDLYTIAGVASGAKTDQQNQSVGSTGVYTIYATAQASGKNISPLESQAILVN